MDAVYLALVILAFLTILVVWFSHMDIESFETINGPVICIGEREAYIVKYYNNSEVFIVATCEKGLLSKTRVRVYFRAPVYFTQTCSQTQLKLLRNAARRHGHYLTKIIEHTVL